MHALVGQQPCPRFLEGLDQVALVQRDDGLDAFGFGGDQRTRELAFREHRLGSNQDQHLVQIGSERLGANLVLAIEKIAPLLDLLYRAFVMRTAPQDLVADDRCALLAAWVADQPLAFRRFDYAVTSMACDHKPALETRCISQTGCPSCRKIQKPVNKQCALEIGFRQTLHIVRVEAHDASVVVHRQIWMVVLRVGNECKRVHKRDRLVVVGEGVCLLDGYVGPVACQFPARRR